MLCRRTCRALPDLKRLLIYKCDIFLHHFRIRKFLPLTLIVSHSPCCCYLCLQAVKTPTWKEAFWGRHDRMAHIGYGGIHCHLAARLRRRRVPQWRDGKLWVHLSSLWNTIFYVPTPPSSPPHLNFNSNVNITAVIILSKHPKSKRRVVQLKQIYNFSHCNLPPSSGHGAKHVCVVLTSHSNKEVEMITRVSRQSFSCMLYH